MDLEINSCQSRVNANLVLGEPKYTEDPGIELFDKYIYLGHKIRICTDNQTCAAQKNQSQMGSVRKIEARILERYSA